MNSNLILPLALVLDNPCKSKHVLPVAEARNLDDVGSLTLPWQQSFIRSRLKGGAGVGGNNEINSLTLYTSYKPKQFLFLLFQNVSHFAVSFCKEVWSRSVHAVILLSVTIVTQSRQNVSCPSAQSWLHFPPPLSFPRYCTEYIYAGY